jgi:hypothetical protein
LIRARYPGRVEPAKTLATWEALRTLPEGVKAEIVGGVLVTPPAPLPRHSSMQGKLRRFIGGAFDDDDGSGGPGGWVFLEVNVRLSPHDIVRPDLAGWRRERLAHPAVRSHRARLVARFSPASSRVRPHSAVSLARPRAKRTGPMSRSTAVAVRKARGTYRPIAARAPDALSSFARRSAGEADTISSVAPR